MRYYVDRAKDFIKEVFPYIRDYMDSPWSLRNKIRQYNADYTRNVKVMSGCARVALITSDYVVKFDYDEDEVRYVGGSENEVHLYEIAKREGFGYLFAEITRVQWMNQNFYIMPRIRGINDNNGRGWQYMTIEERLWCEKHSLTDLHCGNYGFRNGHICIVDYGFQENLTEESSCSDYETSESQSYT